MKPFERAVLSELVTVPKGMRQRVDGLMCSPGLLHGNWWFFHFRLWLMVRKGWVKRSYHVYSPSRWLNSMPFYSITAAGVKALEDELNGTD